jgi:hypothetical protein
MLPRAARHLAGRAPLALDPRRAIAIKRCEHVIAVDVDADALAAALRALLAEPGARFGRIKVKRPAHRVGQPFAAGERFAGCAALDLPLPERVRAWLEDHLLSDPAEIDLLDARRFRYRYLRGAPLAGSTDLRIEPAGAGCRVVLLFEYQEVSLLAIAVLHTFALGWHDQAVYWQVHEAARRAGGAITSSTIHPAYVAR